MKSHSVKYFLFLAFMLLSLVGNTCAEFALIWHGLNQLKTTTSPEITPSSWLVGVYFGQALGFVFFSPTLALIFDRLPKLMASIGMEVVYSISVLSLYFLSSNGLLTPLLITISMVVFATLSSIYRGGLSFSVMKTISEKMEATSVVKYYAYLFNLTVIFGVMLSGPIYERFGMNFSLLFSFFTFLPMPFVYYLIYAGHKIASPAVTYPKLAAEFREGWTAFAGNRNVLFYAVVISITNVCATILPAILSASFKGKLVNNFSVTSAIIAVSTAIATAFIPVFNIFKQSVSLNKVLLYAFTPTVLAGLVYSVTLHPYVFVIVFFLAVTGMTLANLASFQLRLVSINRDMISRVNSFYFAIVSVGQIIGSAFIIPLLSSNLQAVGWIMTGTYLLAILISFVSLKTTALRDIS